VTPGVRVATGIWLVEVRGAVQYPANIVKLSTMEFICPQMSIVLRVRNPALTILQKSLHFVH
jgi:hypothetical protein